MEESNTRESNEARDVKNWLEWTVFGIGLVLVLAIMGYLGYKTYTHKNSPPDIFVEVRPAPSTNVPHAFHVLVHNRGGSSAEEVKVEIKVVENGQDLETAEMQLAFLPQESKREGWVSFEENPAKADTVVARVVSYEKP